MNEMKRILVIGVSGSGKSTLAERLARRLGLPFFASDHFYWEPGWKPTPNEKVHRQVQEIIAQEAWILDGNFDDQREQVWPRADCIVWLDYSLLTVCWRVTTRNLGWLLTRQVTWSGNRMTLSRAFSGLRHTFKSHGIKRRNYPHWLAALPGVNVRRFHSSREADAWFDGL
jgi:adenylate kinase family enzyme